MSTKSVFVVYIFITFTYKRVCVCVLNIPPQIHHLLLIHLLKKGSWKATSEEQREGMSDQTNILGSKILLILRRKL